jgi:hypothetical protein
MVIASIVMMVLVALAAQAQTTPPPGPEQKKLAAFLGTWTGEGKMEASPFGKAGTTKSTMACAWFTGEYQLVCDSEDSGPMGKIKAHSIFGYSAEKKHYFSFGIDSAGYAAPGTAKVDGSSWTFEGTDTIGGKAYWFRTAVKLASPKELSYKSEYSEDGKSWKLQGEGKMTRK